MPVSKRVLTEMRDLTVGNRTVLLNDVQKHVLRQSQEPDLERERHFLHPSEMSKSTWCWRHDYYRITGAPDDTVHVQNPSFRMESVFEEGHDIHRKWQTWLWEMGILYGMFQCTWCDNRWWDISPKECFYCERPGYLRFREVPLEAPHLHLGGHADGGIWIPGEPFRLLEVKSIGLASLRFEAPDLWDRYQNNDSLDKIWQDINRPFASHVRQGALYLYMAIRGVPDVPIPQEMVFIYEWKPTQAVKEFTVRYNARLVERALTGAQMVTDALDTGRPPQRPTWAKDEDAKICASCPYRAVCWHLVPATVSVDVPAPTPLKKTTALKRRKALSR